MANQDGSFIWYELMTTDPEGAAAFYGPVVGWTIEAHSDPAAGGMDYRMIVRGDGGNAGGVLKLTQEMCDGGARPCWLGYLATSDVDAKVADIVADGGKVQMPAFDIEVGRIAMVTDPQGVPFYVMKPIPPEGAPADAKSDVFSPTEAQHVRWNELSTSDADAGLAFYQKHFGWAQEGAMPMGEHGDYRFIQKDGVGIGAVMKMMPETPVAAWTFYIGVDDIDRAVEAIKANGGQLFADPMEIPGGEYALNGSDPQGAYFGLVGPRKS